MRLKRITIYPKDIERLTGRTPRYARKVMQEIRQRTGKEKHHLITVSELCEHLNIRESEAIEQLDLKH